MRERDPVARVGRRRQHGGQCTERTRSHARPTARAHQTEARAARWRGGSRPDRRYTRSRMGPGDHDDEPLDEARRASTRTRRRAARPARPGLGPPDASCRRFVPAGRPAPGRGRAAGRARSSPPALAGAAGALVTVGVLAAHGRARPRHLVERAVGHRAEHADRQRRDRANSWRRGLGLSRRRRSRRATRRARARGSGVCVRHAGEVLTSARLVGDAKTADIVTTDGERHTARVVGRDRVTDLVLLSIDSAANVPAAQLARRQRLRSARRCGSRRAGPAAATSSWVSRAWSRRATPSSRVPGGPTRRAARDRRRDGPAAIGGALVDAAGDVVGIVLGRLDSNGDDVLPCRSTRRRRRRRSCTRTACTEHGSARLSAHRHAGAGPRSRTVTARRHRPRTPRGVTGRRRGRRLRRRPIHRRPC